ncbi:MAG: type II toxin-antitoxin system Phd/YefM family antitoxin [Gammaproteobacteria bacterium]|nr:type II toxin-antitoxin system Phd/YefM family antitoxin [Nitrosomonas sp.]QOJ24126.1 MAG: type II toxin-antitoxin system Phd/YefM family antitoxin [Gammaproteobacteria bacterium]
MLTINIHEAKTHLSRFIEKAAAGEEIIIAKAGKPVAKLVPLHSLPSARSLGIFKGKLNVPEDFDAALPEDVMMQFQNAAIEPSSENR